MDAGSNQPAGLLATLVDFFLRRWSQVARGDGSSLSITGSPLRNPKKPSPPVSGASSLRAMPTK